jgi:hypothetical protein
MADWIYCATRGQVGAAATQSLLRAHQVIWCAPRSRRRWPGVPIPGERLWLVWQGQQDGDLVVLLLGGGRLVAHAELRFGSNLLWTTALYPGIYAEAVRLGYSGASSMSFLRLEAAQVTPAENPPQVPGLGPLPIGLSQAAPPQVALLEREVPLACSSPLPG